MMRIGPKVRETMTAINLTEAANSAKASESFSVEEHRLKAKNYVRANIERLLARRGVPPRYISARIEHFRPAARQFLTGSYFVHGDNGLGKTHLSVAIMREAILGMEPERKHDWSDEMVVRTERMPIFVNVPDLVLEFRESQEKEAAVSEFDLLRKYAGMDFLILDDIGAEKTSEWVLQTMYVLVNRRYVNMKRTLITSNLSLPELAAKLSDRIVSRIGAMCTPFCAEGKNWRAR